MSSPDVAPCCRAAAHQSRCSLSSTEARERPLGLARGRRWRSGFPVFILFSLTRLSCGRRPALPTNIYYRRSVEKRDPWRRVHDARRHSTQDICKTRYITNACVHCVSIVATVTIALTCTSVASIISTVVIIFVTVIFATTSGTTPLLPPSSPLRRSRRRTRFCWRCTAGWRSWGLGPLFPRLGCC